MIWDCFMFGGERELDLLELRLRTTGPYVDRFVVAESPVTFQGTPKPLAYPDNLDRFQPWAAKITYLVVPPLAAAVVAEDSWAQERHQRSYLLHGLDTAEPDDTVLMGDLDEIPDLAGWTPPAERPEVCILRQHVFAVDWVHSLAVAGTAVIPWRFWLDQDRPPFNVVRELRMKFAQRWGGWHFSWLGGPAAIREKVTAHSHLELNAEIGRLNEKGLLYEAGWVPWDKVWQMPARVNQTWPQWVREKECPASWFRP